MLHFGSRMSRAFQGVAAWLILSALLSALGAQNGSTRKSASGQPLTFNRDVAPIIYRSCALCHHRGEAGPFPLLTYTDVKLHARQIAVVTQKRVMPPWLPEPGEP